MCLPEDKVLALVQVGREALTAAAKGQGHTQKDELSRETIKAHLLVAAGRASKPRWDLLTWRKKEEFCLIEKDLC